LFRRLSPLLKPVTAPRLCLLELLQGLLEEARVQLCLREPLHEPVEPHLRRGIVETAERGEVRVVPKPLDELGEAVYLEEHLDEYGPEVGRGWFGSSASAFHVVEGVDFSLEGSPVHVFEEPTYSI